MTMSVKEKPVEQQTQHDGLQKNEDMRFSLTDWERESVKRLKGACDAKGVSYKSLFELAKYVLVVKSSVKDSHPKVDEKRLQLAFERIQKRRAWEAKHNLDTVDDKDAIHQFGQAAPEYVVSRFTRDKEGHVVVGTHLAFAPTKFCKQQQSVYLAAEQFRFDLAAADMEEARRGFCLVCVAERKLNLASAWNYIRFLHSANQNLLPMHCHRLRRVYGEVPPFLAHLVQFALGFVPIKIANRLVISPNLEGIVEKHMDKVQQEMSLQEWTKQRLAVYNETLDKLRLD